MRETSQKLRVSLLMFQYSITYRNTYRKKFIINCDFNMIISAKYSIMVYVFRTQYYFLKYLKLKLIFMVTSFNPLRQIGKSSEILSYASFKE